MYPTDEALAIANRGSNLTGDEQALSFDHQTPSTSRGVSRTDTRSSKATRTASPLEVELPPGEHNEPEVIEESGPVKYLEEEVEEGGLDDDEIEGLAYDEDPLLHSDYEDEGIYIHVLICMYTSASVVCSLHACLLFTLKHVHYYTIVMCGHVVL